jgi:hypothetical protein
VYIKGRFAAPICKYHHGKRAGAREFPVESRWQFLTRTNESDATCTLVLERGADAYTNRKMHVRHYELTGCVCYSKAHEVAATAEMPTQFQQLAQPPLAGFAVGNGLDASRNLRGTTACSIRAAWVCCQQRVVSFRSDQYQGAWTARS